MSESDIREVVRERYAEAAQNVRAGASCCEAKEWEAKLRDIGHLDGAMPRASP